MNGITLMLSTICLNSSFCPNQQPNVGINLNEAFKTAEILKAELKKIADELRGQTLNITTLEDFPLSYVERDNKTGAFVGKGK
jgi:fructose-bisphosphate aldolase class 1